MGNVYTKTGDKGMTSLYSGERVDKDELRVDCYGTIDEAISMMGMAYSMSANDYVRDVIKNIQRSLFVVGEELASLEKKEGIRINKIKEQDIDNLEKIIDYIVLITGKPSSFVIPGVNMPSSALHVSRTIVRRAERLIIGLSKKEVVSESLIKYVNRLSDCLYALARLEEHEYIVNLIKEKVVKRMNNITDKLTLAFAVKMAELAEKKAREIEVPIVFSVVDDGGNIVLVHRMEDSLLASIDISINKAYTASSLKITTDSLGKLAHPGNSLYGIESTNNGRIVLFGGGYPVKASGKVIGGIGISGGTVDEDMIIGRYVMDNLQEVK